MCRSAVLSADSVPISSRSSTLIWDTCHTCLNGSAVVKICDWRGSWSWNVSIAWKMIVLPLDHGMNWWRSPNNGEANKSTVLLQLPHRNWTMLSVQPPQWPWMPVSQRSLPTPTGHIQENVRVCCLGYLWAFRWLSLFSPSTFQSSGDFKCVENFELFVCSLIVPDEWVNAGKIVSAHSIWGSRGHLLPQKSVKVWSGWTIHSERWQTCIFLEGGIYECWLKFWTYIQQEIWAL